MSVFKVDLNAIARAKAAHAELAQATADLHLQLQDAKHQIAKLESHAVILRERARHFEVRNVALAERLRHLEAGAGLE